MVIHDLDDWGYPYLRKPGLWRPSETPAQCPRYLWVVGLEPARPPTCKMHGKVGMETLSSFRDLSPQPSPVVGKHARDDAWNRHRCSHSSPSQPQNMWGFVWNIWNKRTFRPLYAVVWFQVGSWNTRLNWEEHLTILRHFLLLVVCTTGEKMGCVWFNVFKLYNWQLTNPVSNLQSQAWKNNITSCILHCTCHSRYGVVQHDLITDNRWGKLQSSTGSTNEKMTGMYRNYAINR